jgi:exonuclease VII small subunit
MTKPPLRLFPDRLFVWADWPLVSDQTSHLTFPGRLCATKAGLKAAVRSDTHLVSLYVSIDAHERELDEQRARLLAQGNASERRARIQLQAARERIEQLVGQLQQIGAAVPPEELRIPRCPGETL